jgi:hypothetical protein
MLTRYIGLAFLILQGNEHSKIKYIKKSRLPSHFFPNAKPPKAASELPSLLEHKRNLNGTNNYWVNVVSETSREIYRWTHVNVTPGFVARILAFLSSKVSFAN